MEVVLPSGQTFFYARVLPEDAKPIILRHFKGHGLKKKISNTVSNLLDNMLAGGDTEPVTRYSLDVREKPVSDFLGKQKYIASEHCGVMDPEDMDEYLSGDGFKALEKCIHELTPEQVIKEIEISGLRGRISTKTFFSQ